MVAMFAYSNGAPFLAVRSVSDLAGQQPDPEQLAVFLAVAVENSSRVVLRLLELLLRAWSGNANARSFRRRTFMYRALQ